MTLRFSDYLWGRHPPLWRQALLYAPIALLPAAGLSIVIAGLLSGFGADVASLTQPQAERSALSLFGSIFLTPVVETLLLAWILELLLAASDHRLFVATTSALIWGGLHGLRGPLAFAGPAWGFFVFSCAYLAWREVSFRHGFAAASIPHMVSNACTFGIGVLTGSIT